MPRRPERVRRGGALKASTINSLVDMHDEIYSPLQDATARSEFPARYAACSMHPDVTEDVEPYTPVRIISVSSFEDSGRLTSRYVVAPVNFRHNSFEPRPSYGIAGYTGVKAEGGGFVAVDGLAVVSAQRKQVVDGVFDDITLSYTGIYDNCWYVINDGSIFVGDTDIVVASVGHFKVIGTADVTEVGNALSDAEDIVLLTIDLSSSPAAIRVNLDTGINGGTIDGDDLVILEGEASVRKRKPSEAADSEFSIRTELESIDKFKIRVFNYSPEDVAAGEHIAIWSSQLGVYIIPNLSPQRVKIGKADSDISVDTTGTISIWRAGVDTTENVSAKLDWMAGTTQVSSGKEVMITYFADEAIWRITGAECED